ncbi:MAG: sulfatase [Planctomycetota bacterium]
MTGCRCAVPLLMGVGLVVACAGVATPAQPKSKSYNVLFIAIDDLNDWAGPFGGNPQVKTPRMDRFAEKAVVFSRAYCPGTVCGPSRSALLTGKHAAHTGVYGNSTNLKNAPKARDLETLPEYFGNRGYHTLSAGKIFHKHATKDGLDEGQWAFHEMAHPGGDGGVAWSKTAEHPQIKISGSPLSWGATKAPLERTKDYVACKWAADQLDRDFEGKPFFLALGLSKPHLPFNVPQEFFDMYPLEEVEIAPVKMTDYDDIVRADGSPVYRNVPDPTWLAAEASDAHDDLNRAYMAAVSYVDACLGVVFEALENSRYADNTIVVVWGDHGWYLGEKLRYRKTHLWEEAARVPLMVRAPGVSPEGVRCEGVVNLIDMYPTLLELCGLPANPKNDGRSFAPLLADPSMKWNVPTLTTDGYMNHSLTDGRYRYIWYGGLADGAEELYDHSTDPLEHDNLAYKPEYRAIIAGFKQHLPTHNEPRSPENTSEKKGRSQ